MHPDRWCLVTQRVPFGSSLLKINSRCFNVVPHRQHLTSRLHIAAQQRIQIPLPQQARQKIKQDERRLGLGRLLLRLTTG